MDHSGILIVDDEVVIAEELSEFLTSFDYPCQTAISVDQALEAVDRDENISMILTDMRMPGRDGSELIQILQSEEGRQISQQTCDWSSLNHRDTQNNRD